MSYGNFIKQTKMARLSSSSQGELVGTAEFSTAIPLTFAGQTYMPQQTVSSVLAFTVAASPVQGALVYVRLVADGTNAPTFTGMKEWGGSLGYDNRAGIVNEVQFFYDGYDYWFSISQAIGAVAVDTVAPTAGSALVANAAPTIVAITMSEALDPAYVPAASAFTVSGHTVSSAAISGSTINLTCTAAFVNGEAARTTAYTQPGTNNARDIAGNLLASFTGLAITNNVGVAATGGTLTGPSTGPTSAASSNFTVGFTPNGSTVTGTVRWTPASTGSGDTITPAFLDLTSGQTGTFTVTSSATAGARTISLTNNGSLANPTALTYTTAAVSVLRFGQLSTVSESGTSPAYVYTGTSGTNTYTGYGVLDKTFGTGDATITMRVVQRTNNFIIGLTTSATPVPFGSMPFGIYSNINGDYLPIVDGAPGGANGTAGVYAANDMIRLKRVGGVLTSEFSHDAGATWTVSNTWNNIVATTPYRIQLAINAGVVVDQITGTGLI
jgi:hypothetical protein